MYFGWAYRTHTQQNAANLLFYSHKSANIKLIYVLSQWFQFKFFSFSLQVNISTP